MDQIITQRTSTKHPIHLSQFAQSTITKAHSVYDQQETLMREFHDRILDNASANVDAAFDVAAKLTRARNVPEVAKIQNEFFQTQSGRMLGQLSDTVFFAANSGWRSIEARSSLLIVDLSKPS